MKYALLLLIVAFGLCAAQSHYPYPSTPKLITTAVDTTVLATKSYNVCEVTITNYNAIDTVLYRTNYTSGWNYLYPLESDHMTSTYAEKIYIKTLSGTAVVTLKVN